MPCALLAVATIFEKLICLDQKTGLFVWPVVVGGVVVVVCMFVFEAARK